MKATRHRQVQDRRQTEKGPPAGWKDRRNGVERRLPQVVENEVSLAEFFAAYQQTQAILRESAEDSVPPGIAPLTKIV